jgi:hypothetical protein
MSNIIPTYVATFVENRENGDYFHYEPIIVTKDGDMVVRAIKTQDGLFYFDDKHFDNEQDALRHAKLRLVMERTSREKGPKEMLEMVMTFLVESGRMTKEDLIEHIKRIYRDINNEQ